MILLGFLYFTGEIKFKKFSLLFFEKQDMPQMNIRTFRFKPEEHVEVQFLREPNFVICQFQDVVLCQVCMVKKRNRNYFQAHFKLANKKCYNIRVDEREANAMRFRRYN